VSRTTANATATSPMPPRRAFLGRLGTPPPEGKEPELPPGLLGAGFDLRPSRYSEHLQLWHVASGPPPSGTQLPLRWGLDGWTYDDQQDVASITVEGSHHVMRTDQAGVVPIYYRTGTAATWFASSLDLLVRTADAQLHPDWDAWAEIIQFGYPLGDATPFEEIRRLGPDQELRCEGDGRTSIRTRTWSWSNLDGAMGSFQDRAHQVVDELRTTLSKAQQPLTVPLSGGWDSRLLLACAPDELLAGSITVDTDTGRDIEQRFAAGVAAARGVSHHIVEPDHAHEYWRDAEVVARTTGFQTSLHPWMARLVEGLPPDQLLADGLAGDVLLKGLFATDAVIEASDRASMLDALWHSLAPARSPVPLVSTAAASAWEASARARLAGVYESFSSHPSAPTLTIYRTRTVRGVSLASSHLLASVADVLTPFTSSAVAAVALSLHPRERHGGDFYRLILQAANPALARLPSTNDKGVSQLALRARRELAPDTQRWYVQHLLETPVREALSGTLLLRLEAGRTAELFLRRREMYAVRGLALLGHWLRTYGDVLADARLPEDWHGRTSTKVNDRDRPDPWLDEVLESSASNRALRLSWRGGLHFDPIGTLELDRERTDGVIPIADASVDVLLLDDVLRFVGDPDLLRDEVRRVVAQNGIVAVSSPWPVKGTPAPRPTDVHAWVSSIAAPTSVSVRAARIRIIGHEGGNRDLRGEDVSDSLASELLDAIGRLQIEQRKRRATRAELDELRGSLENAAAHTGSPQRSKWWKHRAEPRQ
jgi:hypothetical protein